MLPVGVLVVGLVLMLWRPAGLPVWAGPLASAVAAVAVTGATEAVGDAVEVLWRPLLFLAFAVPLAALLDRLGFFAAAAATLDVGHGLHRRLWWLTAGVVVLFNLDAAVVLLTPLYIRIARRHGVDPLALALQPALLACLASGLLPVSNLTNLLAAEAFDLGATQFLAHLGLPTVAAVGVGWLAYRRTVLRGMAPAATGPAPGALDAVEGAGDGSGGAAAHRAALRRGLPVVAFVLVGFTLGDRLGVPAWAVAAVAVAGLAVATRALPWRAVPVEAVVLTLSLGVLVAATSPHLHLDQLLGHEGRVGDLAAFAFGALGSLAANNLPAAQAGLGALAHPDQVWALLVGLNMVPLVLLTASLSNLLWRDTAAGLDLPVSSRAFTALTVRVALPATAAALAVLLASRAL